jgi:hypothetical protein
MFNTEWLYETMTSCRSVKRQCRPSGKGELSQLGKDGRFIKNELKVKKTTTM